VERSIGDREGGEVREGVMSQKGISGRDRRYLEFDSWKELKGA
jgi:hypothetical protein